MVKEPVDYLSYLLRLWRSREDRGSGRESAARIWRASLENAQTGDRAGFGNLEELFAHLRRQTGSAADLDGSEIEPERATDS
jgi:hypothetical protein